MHQEQNHVHSGMAALPHPIKHTVPLGGAGSIPMRRTALCLPHVSLPNPVLECFITPGSCLLSVQCGAPIKLRTAAHCFQPVLLHLLL